MVDLAVSIINCRRAMDFAVKWMYSVDKDLEKSYQDTDVKVLEQVLWGEVGTKRNYENEYGNKLLGEFVPI